MLLILISWIYSLFLVVNLGVGFAKWLKVKVTDLVLLSFFGLFSTTILAGFWAVFYRINFEFHLVFLLLNLILFLVFKKSIIGVYQELWTRIKSLALVFKIILSVIALLIIAQCASVPYLIDNETYYIQTIKWLNEYGFVKGLANLDMLFAQTSGWHIAQSALNFSFIFSRFNDLSGFCLLLANVYAILQLQDFYKSNQQNKGLLLMGMLPLFNVLLFQFISAPSPDLVVYVLRFVIFSYIISNYKSLNLDDFKLISIMVFWGFIVKSTSIINLFIPLFLFLTNFKTLYKGALKIIFLGALVLSLFVIKNTILLGYPLFPLRFTLFSSENYAVPNEIIQFYFSREGLYRFFVSSSELQSKNVLQIIWRWLTFSVTDMIFNSSQLFLLLTIPFVIKKHFNHKSYWMLYSVMVLQFILLVISSPQYRFFMGFTMFFTGLIISLFANQKRMTTWIIASTSVTVILVFIPINLSKLTPNKMLQTSNTFRFNNLIFPAENSKHAITFEVENIGNLSYHSLPEESHFWSTGDGKLPAVNKQQIEYFRIYFHFVPQLRTTHLKDGFYSKKVTD